jgi:hypothetical protein
MKKKLFNLILILVTTLMWSQKQDQNDYTISLNGNRIITTSNFKEQFSSLKSKMSKQNKKKDYLLVQFTKMPTQLEQQKMLKQGVELLSYLSNNAYYASISSKFYNEKRVSENIRTIINVDPLYKLDSEIISNKIPEYARESNDLIKVVVSYFKNADQNDVSNDLINLKIKGIRNVKSFNEVHLFASKVQLSEIAKLDWVQNIELVAPPVESENLPSLNSHKVNVLNSNIAGLGYGLSGKGVKMGIWDGNLEKHKDHTGRVIAKEYEDPDSHGNHVAGTALGGGLLDPKAKGMAPEIQAYGWNFNTQSNGKLVYEEREISAIEDGIEITQNSFGITLTAGYSLVRYNNSDRGDDLVMNKFPYLLNVYSNGNAQAANPGGFNTSTKNSKNAIHVAANNPDELISNYSSFGPTIDGRLVPQITAVGTSVYSLDYLNSYQFLQGTSMATPGVSGTIALLYERYKNIYEVKPLASLMKAIVCNTARDVGNPGPDYKYGFGNINAIRAVKAIDNKRFYTASIGNGATFEKDIVVPAGLVSLKVMMAYTDVPTTPGATNILINNLDIKIIKDGVEILPWVLNPTIPNSNASRGVDNLNNIEQITLDNPTAGTYKIVVTGSSIPLGTQEFSVVYDYVTPELKLTYPIGNEKFNPGNTEYIRWDYEGEAKTFNIEYSIDGGLNYSTIAQNVPANSRSYTWRVPDGVVANAKIRISAGSKVDYSKENFVVMIEPKNLVIAPATCGVSSYKMDWDAIPGAKYEVLKLNGYQFDSVAIVTDPTYTFENLSVGEDNWFSVRAIDIVTNAISERVRAVNVEPIDKPLLTAVSLPFEENFNERKATKYTISKASVAGRIGYEYYSKDFVDGIKVSGNATASPTPWVASTSADAFTNNPTFIKRLTFCDIDASSLTGKALRLKFNLKWNAVAANKSFFRVTVNGTPLINSIDNVSVYGGVNLTGETVLTYDLSAFAGTSFNLNLETVIDNDFTGPTNNPVYNTLFFDNIEIFEPTTVDLEMNNLTANTGLTSAETVSVVLNNLSASPISNIPVSYKINNQETVTEIIAGPVNPLSKINYSFTQKADFSQLGAYNVNATVNYSDDTVLTNNSITKTVLNVGADVLMGSSPSVTNCNAVFTDAGNRFNNYGNNLNQTITFVPAIAGNSVKVDFTNFAIEKDFDFLFIYNGPTTSSPLLGRYTGNVLPPSVTSTATGGQLTFRFTSDGADVDSGWIANISCVPTPTTSDAGILSIITPEILGKKTSTNDIKIRVVNIGSTALTNVPVFYQVDGGAKVTDVVPNIDANTTFEFTFATKADLSVVDAKYTITSGIDQDDVNTANNSLSKVVYNKNELPVHTNTNGYAISKLKWDNIENNSSTSAYSDFKSIKIPVYAGFTYQPEVTIVKPERPITRDLNNPPGVFTMMVIDLNGDGNLTDEFYARNFWVNTINTATAPAIASSTANHYFRNEFSLVGGVTIPSNTTPGEKLMRVIHMFRSPNESYNVNLGPTLDGLTSSRGDFEIEEYTIDVIPFLPLDASVESISIPLKLINKPVNVSAVIRNYSNASISNFPIAYRVNGGAEVVETVTATIATGASVTYTFTTKADLSLPSNYNVEVYTKLEGDAAISNDSKVFKLSNPLFANNVVGSFDGINDYIVSDTTTPLNLTNNYTFEAWINQKAPSVFGRILDKSRILFFVHNNNNLALYKENSLVLSITTAGGSYVLNTDLNSIKQNRYHHVAFTVSTANVYTIYIDGQVANYTITSAATIPAGPATANATNPIFIGNNATLGRAFNGNIDEVRIWNNALDQTTIANNLTTKYIGNESGLIAYYPFSEGDKQFIYDNSNNNNVATVLNANTDGLGLGKFWNIPSLLQNIQFDNQISNTYDPSTRTFNILLSNGTNIANLIANFNPEMNSIAKVNGVIQTSGVTPNDFTNPVIYTLEGVGFNSGIVQDYTVKVLSGLNNESKLLSYNFDTTDNPSISQPINTTILGNNVKAIVPFGTDVANLKAKFKVSPGAELFIDQVKQIDEKTTSLDYSVNRILTVVSENKISSTNYTITVDARNDIGDFISYNVSNQIGQSIIDANAKTITVFVNNNANLSSLYPTFEVSPQATARIGTYIQNSGESILKYTTPVSYNVLAQNGNIVNWTVTIQRAKPIITLLGDQIVNMPKECPYIEKGFTAVDNLNNDITSSVVVSGVVDVNTAGQYILNYSVADALNNQSSVTRIVNVSNESCTLAINQTAINGFSLFPNAVKDGKLYVLSASKSMKDIKVYDFLGKQVYYQKTTDKVLNLTNLQKGLYAIKVEQDGNTEIRKLIIE